MKFEIGEIVRLKSGGPKMTVTVVVFGRVGCTWFDEDDNEHRGSYPRAALERV